jgi:hypothetical protein
VPQLICQIENLDTNRQTEQIMENTHNVDWICSELLLLHIFEKYIRAGQNQPIYHGIDSGNGCRLCVVSVQWTSAIDHVPPVDLRWNSLCEIENLWIANAWEEDQPDGAEVDQSLTAAPFLKNPRKIVNPGQTTRLQSEGRWPDRTEDRKSPEPLQSEGFDFNVVIWSPRKSVWLIAMAQASKRTGQQNRLL